MYSISCKQLFKYTVMYGVCTAFLARISSNVRSYTVYVQHFLQESLQMYGYVRRKFMYGLADSIHAARAATIVQSSYPGSLWCCVWSGQTFKGSSCKLRPFT